LQFSTRHCKCPTEETMGAQNFNFDPKFPQNKFFSFKVCTFRRNISDKNNFFCDSPKFRGGVLPATTPLTALKYEAAPLPFVVSGAPGSAVRPCCRPLQFACEQLWPLLRSFATSRSVLWSFQSHLFLRAKCPSSR